MTFARRQPPLGTDAALAGERRALLRASGAPLWLVTAAVLSAVSGVVVVVLRPASLPVAWMSLGVLSGLLAAMVVVAIVIPIGIRRATLFAWLLSGLVIVAVVSAALLLALSLL